MAQERPRTDREWDRRGGLKETEMSVIGLYARCSTADPDPEVQLGAAASVLLGVLIELMVPVRAAAERLVLAVPAPAEVEVLA